MPERPSGTSPKLSTTVQKRLVVIPPPAEWAIRIIGFAIFALSFVKQIQDHIIGSHQEAEHGWLELALEIAPFGVAIAVSVALIAQPAAFAVWVMEVLNKIAHKAVSFIPSKRK